MKTKLISLALLLTTVSWGATSPYYINPATSYSILINRQAQKPIHWKVGDTNTYYLQYGLAGLDLIESVNKINQEGLWVQQVAYHAGQKVQVVDILYDQNNGSIKKILLDGKQQSVSDYNNNEVIEHKQDTVTVPAGTFDCHYMLLKNKKSGKLSKVWLNPEISSIGGLLRLQDSSTAKLSLKSFIRN
jgi:hypothetical protein